LNIESHLYGGIFYIKWILLMEENKRIKILDGFRTIAILSVILFHYYSYWAPPQSFDYYPYHDKYSFFGYGYLGVEFFFIISGFVIAFTLHRTEGILIFWKKRMVRLFPAMLFCSLITLVVVRSLDNESLFPAGHSVLNFFVSLSFLSPALINHCLPSLKADYLTGAYWSLWPEVQFYFIASLIYFYNPSKFVKNFSILSILLYLLNWFVLNVQSTNLFHLHLNAALLNGYDRFTAIFNINSYLLWFTIGVLFFTMYAKKANKATAVYFSIAAICQLYSCVQWEVRIAMLLFLMLFVVFIFYPRWLHFLAYKPIATIGMASYSLYLIHQDIAVLLIHKYARSWGRFDGLFPVLMILIMVLFSLFSYRFFERPVSRLMNSTRSKTKSF
jgi:peptidoglycan/LPS O-acetylase OafA/YrhL